jgi:putative ABC transport system permease protein
LAAFGRVHYLVINTEIDPRSLVGPIREEVKRFDSNLPISEIRTTGQLLNETMEQRSFHTLLFVLFAALALILVAAGIYATTSYHVVQDFHEIGIRMALGAGRKRILVDVLSRGLKQALAGTAIGLVGVLALSRVLENMVYGISPTDPLAFAMVSGLLIFIALVACSIPARRAARISPLESLRSE